MRHKVNENLGLCVIFLICSLTSIQCQRKITSPFVQNNPEQIEKLNIDSIMTIDKDADKHKTVIIGLGDKSKKSFNYEETNLDTKVITNIYGSDQEGYKKTQYTPGNHFGSSKEYFPNGNIQLQENIYIEYPENNRYKKIDIKFPIGVSYKYDINGNIIKEINYEAYFKISIDKLTDFINKQNHEFLKNKSKHFVFEYPSIDRYASTDKKHSVLELNYPDRDEKNRKVTRRIQFNGNTGKKTRESVTRIFTGDIDSLLREEEMRLNRNSIKKQQ